MEESTAWAIATQQSHALNKSPKNYGTSEARQKAKNKYKTPKDDEKQAFPKHGFHITESNGVKLLIIKLRELINKTSSKGNENLLKKIKMK